MREREREGGEGVDPWFDQTVIFSTPSSPPPLLPPRYGLGTNSMTGGQKSGLIYGALVAFFALFIAGYFMD